MPHYKFTPEAECDIEGIVDYTLNRWGASQASKYIDGLEELAQNLASAPALGADRSALLEGLMSFPYVSHILYYVKQPHGITIIRVLHKRMDHEQHIVKQNTI